MSVDLPHLHGILKDKTRGRILELLEQRGRLSYVELQNLLEVSHTGKLNYHLKILGDLISKDEQSGQYSLSEKGGVAVILLGKFQAMSASGAVALKAKLKLGVADLFELELRNWAFRSQTDSQTDFGRANCEVHLDSKTNKRKLHLKSR